MKMKTLALTAAIVATGLCATAANAAQHTTPDGTITFSGKVVTDTCSVQVNGGSTSASVTLPTVFSSQLPTAGSTAGDTSFNISVSNCDAGITSVQTFFSGSDIDTTTGRLNNGTSGTASNVQLQLLQDNDSTAMDLRGADASAQHSKSYTPSSGAATLTYYARYYATGTVGAGSVSSTVNFTMVYQ